MKKIKLLGSILLMIALLTGLTGGITYAEDEPIETLGVSEVVTDTEDRDLSTGNGVEDSGEQQVILTDIAGHWSEKYIIKAIEHGYVDGFPNGTFRPDAQVSRAQFTKMLVGALGLPVEGKTGGSNWHEAYATAAVKAGIHAKADFKADSWSTAMTRNEMARMGARAIGEKAEEEKQWMFLATWAGLIKGVDKYGTLAEEKSMTRAQAVTVIDRVLRVRAGEKLEIDKRAMSNAEVLWRKTNIYTMLPEMSRWRKYDMSDKNLTNTVHKGNISCTVSKFVVIDLSDPFDPNRHYIKGLTYLKMDGENVPMPQTGYIFVSVNHLEVKKNETFLRDMQGCYIYFSMKLLDKDGKRVFPSSGIATNDKRKIISSSHIPVADVKNLSLTYHVIEYIPFEKYQIDYVGGMTFYGLADFGIDPKQLSKGLYPIREK